MQDRRAAMISEVVSLAWQKKLITTDSGPVDVWLHLDTGWMLAPVPNGWIGTHRITGALIRDGSKPRIWADRTEAMLELEHICPDCYGLDLSAPCTTCDGTGKLTGRLFYDVDA